MRLRSFNDNFSVLAFYVALLALFLLSGCARTEAVHLFYTSNGPAILPAPNAPTLTVVMFEDRRSIVGSIGVRRNESPIFAAGSVNTWVSQALADELSRTGPQVSYAINLQIANAASPDYIVTGTIEQIWVKEINPATFQAVVQIGVNISNRRGTLWGQSFSSIQERTGLPRFNLVENLLNETLREVLAVVTPKINEVIR